MAQTKKATATASQTYPMSVNLLIVLFTILSLVFAFMAARNVGMF